MIGQLLGLIAAAIKGEIMQNCMNLVVDKDALLFISAGLFVLLAAIFTVLKFDCVFK
jgi:hypothetical protein